MKEKVITIIKEKYFALYYGQKIAMFYDSNRKYLSQNVNTNIDCYLLLKPIEQISDDDAKIIGYDSAKMCKKILNVSPMNQSELDLIRQLGYATNCTTIVNKKAIALSVNDLIKLGIIKLAK